MTQQEFLKSAKDRLNLTWKDFAKRIGAPEATLKKWTMQSNSTANFREMPNTIWVLVREILEHEELKLKYANLRKESKKSTKSDEVLPL